MSDELSNDARAILGQAVDEERALAPGAERRAGLKRALVQAAAVASTSAVAGKAAALHVSGAAGTGTSVAGLNLAVLAKSVGLGLLVSGGVLGSIEVASRWSRSSEAPAKAALVAPVASASVGVPTHAPAPPPQAAPLVEAPPPATPLPVSAPPSVAASAPPSLRAELELLGAAQAALRDGRAAEALSLFARYDVAFPAGQLTVERLAGEVFAACQVGDRARAGRAAKRFLLRDSDSALAERVKRACPFTNGERAP